MSVEGRVRSTVGDQLVTNVGVELDGAMDLRVNDRVSITRHPGDPDEAVRAAQDALRTVLSFYAASGVEVRKCQRIVSCLSLVEEPL